MCPVLFRFISKKGLYFSLGNAVDNTNELSQPAVPENLSMEASTITKDLPCPESHKTELALLDLYSGCGGMSTGLCLGAKTSPVNLITVIHDIHICNEIICIHKLYSMSSMIH